MRAGFARMIAVAGVAVGALVTGSANGWGQPLGDTTQYLMVNGGKEATVKTGGQGFDGVSLYCGSADTCNTLSVLDMAGNVLKTITGLDFASPGANAPGSYYNDPKYNQYVTYTLDSLTGQKIGGPKFASGNTAFELDMYRSSTPPRPRFPNPLR